MDFLTVTDPAQGITLAGQWIPRPRFGLHLRLGELSEQIQQAIKGGEPQQAAALVALYLDMYGFVFGDLSGVERLACYSSLFDLNKIKMLFAFQVAPSEKHEPAAYDFNGRNWAWWVHKLATRYGWTSEYVFNLFPEEAAAYLQEILVSEYDEIDDRRSLSELAYKYNKITQESKFHPIPRPAWMKEKDSDKPKTRRIRRDMLPIGNVIDLRGKTEDDFIQ